jgi:hypothetical protein
MALMKMGRRGDPPIKKKGEDPKKKAADQKNIQEVTVSAKKPVAKSTWEDVDRQMENKKAWDKYDADMKFYQSGPPANSYKDASGSWQKIDGGQKVSKGGKDVSGRDVSFESSNDTYSASRFNKDADEAMKKDKYVSIDDPSLDETTRSLLKEATYGDEGPSSIYGKPSTKYVKAGTKLKNRTDVWGEEFNHKEWKDAANSGKFEEYANKKGYGGRSFVSKVGFVQRYATPEAPKEDLRKMKINNNDLETPKLPIKRSVDYLGPNKLAVPKKVEKEEATWSDPSVSKAPKKIERAGGSGGGSLQMFGHTKIGGNKVGKGIKYALNNTGIARSINYSKTKQELKKEGRGFKALYGQPSSVSGSVRAGMTLGELAEEKKSLKSALKDKEFKGSSAFTRSEMRNERSGIRKDIRATNLASKYTSKNLTPTSVFDKNGVERVEMQPKENASAKHYKPEMGERYTEFTRQQKQKPQNHPANKNTLESQSNALEPKRSRSQRKEETKIQQSVMNKLKNK